MSNNTALSWRSIFVSAFQLVSRSRGSSGLPSVHAYQEHLTTPGKQRRTCFLVTNILSILPLRNRKLGENITRQKILVIQQGACLPGMMGFEDADRLIDEHIYRARATCTIKTGGQ